MGEVVVVVVGGGGGCGEGGSVGPERRFMKGWRRENTPGRKRDDPAVFAGLEREISKRSSPVSTCVYRVRTAVSGLLCPCRCESISCINHVSIIAALPAHNEKVKRPNIAPIVGLFFFMKP